MPFHSFHMTSCFLFLRPQVAEEAMYGKMYVRGHDREGRPIIHYRPGLEKSFDTEKVSNTSCSVDRTFESLSCVI